MLTKLSIKNSSAILALGAQSAGNFAYLKDGKIFHSSDFGDLQDVKNWKKYKLSLQKEIKNSGLKPRIILSDLHPDFLTTSLAKDLAKKYKAKHIPVQHHLAHIFSAIGDKIIDTKSYKLEARSFGIACDGTGYGLDGKIWGGEIFKVKSAKLKVKSLMRIGHLENQTLIGGDLAIQEPARMLIGILKKSFSSLTSLTPKDVKSHTYSFVKKYYTKNEFELIYNQLKQNFNCLETSSAGRVLDAMSILLGFCGNERKYKHEPIEMLEKNSTTPYDDLKPKIKESYEEKLKTTIYELDTTHLFNYVISAIGGSAFGGNYLHKDKRRLAATAQLYIAEGLYEVLKKIQNTKYQIPNTFLAGGMANNKIISTYLESKGIYTNKKIPRGDAGISFGQIIYYLLANPRD